MEYRKSALPDSHDHGREVMALFRYEVNRIDGASEADRRIRVEVAEVQRAGAPLLDPKVEVLELEFAAD